MFFCYLNTTVGLLELEANTESLLAVRFVEEPNNSEQVNSILKQAKVELESYFNGDLKQFEVPLSPNGTDFQQRVWNELLHIPFGKTISYLELAERLGDKLAIRAAASANGKNPIPILIPCHRVIGSDGSLTGYSGGLERKRALLELEGVLTKQQSLF